MPIALAPLVLAFVPALARQVAEPAPPAYPPSATLEEVRALVERSPKTHPRLLLDAEGLVRLRESVEAEPLRKALAELVVAQADALLDEPPIERKLEGIRLLSQSRRCVERALALSMAFHLTGEEKYVRRCETELLAAARFVDWNPSHFLDVAEMTFALAVGYDWLFDELDPAARAEVRAAIVEKGVRLPFAEGASYWWTRATNNWGQVCHGGLTAGALAVMEDEPELAARTVHHAIHNVTVSMAVYAPKGCYPEGPGYWSYGTTYNALLIASLESALGTDFGLSLAPGFDETGGYLALATGPSGRTFNYADGGWQRSPQPALLWFAARYGRPDWLLGEYERLEASVRGPAKAGYFAVLSLLWMEDGMQRVDPAATRLPLSWSSGGGVPITVHRSSWSDPNATFVGVKAGSPSANHGHMDAGSFVLDADGVRWAHDLGAEGYHRIESRGMSLWSSRQDSDRWKIFRLSNPSHNTLVIDGALQRAMGRAEVVSFGDGPDGGWTVVDLGPVHADHAAKQDGDGFYVLRGVKLLKTGQVVVQDELAGLRPGATVRWGMLTLGEPGQAGERRIGLTQEGASLSLEVVAPPAPTWTVIDTATPRNEWDSPNPGTAMVAFEAVVPDSGALTLCVWLTPGSCESPDPPLLLEPSVRGW